MTPSARAALVLALALLVPAGPARAQPGVGDLWDGPLPAEPFDAEPFRPIRVPEWVRSTVGCGYTLSGMDTRGREAAVAHGVAISELNFIDPFYPYYDSKLLKRRSPHVPLDRLPKDIAEYKRLRLRILAVSPPCLQGEVYQAHPDWRRIATNTTEVPSIDLEKYPHGGMLCLLGPYGEFFIEVLAEILTTFPDVDAFSFDGLHHGGVCYCAHCRAAYRRDAGAEIPDANLDDPAFRRYQHWADRRLESLVRRIQARLKGIKPDVALVTWTTNAGRWGHFLSIPRNMPARLNLLFDAPDQEFWLDETNRGTTIVPAFANAYIWATTNHRVAFSEPYLMSHGNPYGKDSFPPQEVLHRMLLALTHGAAPSIAVAQPAHLHGAVVEGLDEVNRRRPWLTHKAPEPWSALVMSDNTRNFYGRSAGRVEDRYLAHVLGTFRAVVEEHLPVAVINDWNLNPADLARYRVVILPNTACLDDAQAAALAGFVRDGGGLVASLDASLFDAYGTPRADFALADVLGVSHRGLPTAPPPGKEDLDVNFARSIGTDYWERRKDVFEFRRDRGSFLTWGKLDAYLGDQPVTFKGPAVRVAVTDPSARTIGTIRPKASPDGPEIPAVVSRTYGKGRVAYLAAGFDAGYYLYAYPYERLILRHAIEWAALDPPPVEVLAPLCVHAPVMRQTRDGASRLIVHLFNDLNTTAHHARPDDDVPLREEVVPILDIRVRFDPKYRLGRIHLEPGGVDLDPTATPLGTTVTVPRLDVHAMVVAELEP